MISSARPNTHDAVAEFEHAQNLHRAGRISEAEQIYRQILHTQPAHFASLHGLGLCHFQRGDHKAAVELINHSLRVNPNQPYAWNNLGAAHLALDQPDQALHCYNRAIALKQDYAEAYGNRGSALARAKRYDEALASYDAALALQPRSASIYYNRGNALRELHRHGEALVSFDQALMLKPDYAVAHNNRGLVLLSLNRYADALASFEKALALNPDNADAHHNRGTALRELKRFGEALASYDQALVLRPDYVDAHNNRGTVLIELERLDEARASYERSLQLKPDSASACNNLGVVFADLHRPVEALACYERALAVDPEYVDARMNASICRLLMGDYALGWQEYEWRWNASSPLIKGEQFQTPGWRGDHDLGGKTILLHAEQGLGDTIQFCRYAPIVADLGARVILQVQPELKALMKSLAGPAQVLAEADQLPDFDYQCPLLSLPLALRDQIATIPDNVPYLAADPEHVAAWRKKLGPKTKLRVGITWAGNPHKQIDVDRQRYRRVDRMRSLSFDMLAPLFEINEVEFHGVQKGEDALAQMHSSRFRERVADWSGELTDFSQTAALVQNLDLVISVDTSVVHLTGAIGKPFWLLNRFNTCWRWLIERDDSPWYPGARIFRQPTFGDWDTVINRVATELKQLLGNNHP